MGYQIDLDKTVSEARPHFHVYPAPSLPLALLVVLPYDQGWKAAAAILPLSTAHGSHPIPGVAGGG